MIPIRPALLAEIDRKNREAYADAAMRLRVRTLIADFLRAPGSAPSQTSSGTPPSGEVATPAARSVATPALRAAG